MNQAEEILYRQKIRSKRILAYLIDLAIWVLICFCILVIFYAAGILQRNTVKYVTYIYSAIFLCKDLIGIGKRTVGLQVVYAQNNQKAAWYDTVIRNFTLFLMPIEIILFFNDSPRLGDRINNTKVMLKK